MRRRRAMKNQGFTAEEKVIVTNYTKNLFRNIDLYNISEDLWNLFITLLPKELLVKINKIIQSDTEIDDDIKKLMFKSFQHSKSFSRACIHLSRNGQKEIFSIIKKYIYTVKSNNLVLKKVKQLSNIFDLSSEELEIITFST